MSCCTRYARRYEETQRRLKELSHQLFVRHASARSDLLRLGMAAVAEEGAMERTRQFFIALWRRVVDAAPDALADHLARLQEWLALLLHAAWDVQPVLQVFVPLAPLYPQFAVRAWRRPACLTSGTDNAGVSCDVVSEETRRALRPTARRACGASCRCCAGAVRSDAPRL